MDLFIIYLASSNYKLSRAVCKNTVNSIQIQKYPLGSNSATEPTVWVADEKLTKHSDQVGLPARRRLGAHISSSGVAKGECWWPKAESDFSEVRMMF